MITNHLGPPPGEEAVFEIERLKFELEQSQTKIAVLQWAIRFYLSDHKRDENILSEAIESSNKFQLWRNND